MSLGDSVTKGQAWRMSYGAFSYTGYMPTSWQLQVGDADDYKITGTRGETLTHILTDPRIKMSGDLLIKDTGSITPPRNGTWVSLIGPHDVAEKKYYVLNSNVAFSSGVSRLSLSLMLEDSQSNHATLASDTANYSVGSHASVAGTITFNGATVITGIVDSAGTALALTTDYTVVGTTLTLIGSAYLQTALTVPAQTSTLTVSFDVGAPFTLTITATA